MPDKIDALVELQQDNNQIVPEGLALVSSPLLPTRPLSDRISNFDENVYDLSPESHLRKFLSALLGDAGVGALRKSMLLRRFSQTLHGTNFYDLDRFYGALFNVERSVRERLAFNPVKDVATLPEWETEYYKDSSYRSRLEQLGQAINAGATPLGMKLAAEALLSAECSVFEMWRYEDSPTSYAADLGKTGSRREFVIRASRDITPEERLFLLRVLERIKPADSVITIDTGGINNLEEQAISNIWSDSQKWEIFSRVTDREVGGTTPYGSGTNDVIELPRPPLTGYEGEAWSYRSDVLEVNAYTTQNPSTPNFQRVEFITPTGEQFFRDYLPSQALFSSQALLSGRLANDGVTVIHPFAQYGDLTKIYFDHIDADSMLAALEALNEPVLLPSSQDFWSTPARAQESDVEEVIEVALAAPRLINQMSFDVANFPQRVKAQVLTRTGWEEIGQFAITESLPSTINTLPSNIIVHPQHNGPGHWKRIRFRLGPALYQRVRIILVRSEGQAPTDVLGNAIPYSLGVRHLEIGYRVRTPSDVPYLGRGSEETPVGSSIDRLETPVEFLYRPYRATNALDDDTTVWKSEPQPVKNAVVNLYVETRSADGEAEKVDRFFLDPAVTGPTFSLYSSNDEPDGDTLASEQVISPVITGEVESIGSVSPPYINFDNDAPAYFDISNQKIQLDPNKAWWIGATVLPANSATDIFNHPIISFGQNELAFTQDALTFTTNSLDSGAADVISVPADHSEFATVNFVLAHIPQGFVLDKSKVDFPGGLYNVIEEDLGFYQNLEEYNYEDLETFGGGPLRTIDKPGLYLFYRRTGQPPVSAYLGNVEKLSSFSTIRVGGSLVDETAIGGMRLRRIVIKEEPLRPTTVSDFFGTSQEFVIPPVFPSNGEQDRTRNAILRIVPTWPLDQEFDRIIVWGGPRDLNALRRWRPVGLSFRLTKGLIRFPAKKAKYWKFEFTNLVGKPYENLLVSSGAPTRTVKIHPIPPSRDAALPRSLASDLDFQNLVRRIVAGLREQTVTRQTDIRIQQVLNEYRITPLQLLTALDANTARRLRERSWVYGWEDHHIAPYSYSFEREGVHEYDILEIEHHTNVAYYVGVRYIQAFKIDEFAESDELFYRDILVDDDVVDSSNWTITEDGWFASAAGAQALSKAYESFTDVEAVQVAAQRSDARQILADQDFRNLVPGYNFDGSLNWELFGTAILNYLTDTNTVEVRRFISGSYLNLEQDLGFYINLEDYTYEGLEALGLGLSGGIQSELQNLSTSGRYYAACKLTVDRAPTVPLWLQVVDENDNVLGEQSFLPQQGERTVFWFPYFSFTPPDKARVRLIQKLPSEDVWRVSSIALFDTRVVIEFSNDDGVTWVQADIVANNPYGLVSFPQPGRRVRWRVTSCCPNSYLGSLSFRPWYRGQLPTPINAEHRGGNMTPDDFERSIDNDPDFKRWALPVPAWWVLGS
jgi:hypothetical protein